jgi:hypothetical protein
VDFRDEIMTVDKFRDALKTEPFVPFTILTADGRRYPVRSREFVLMPPKAERTFVVAQDPERYVLLDLLMVVGLEFGIVSQRRRKAS